MDNKEIEKSSQESAIPTSELLEALTGLEDRTISPRINNSSANMSNVWMDSNVLPHFFSVSSSREIIEDIQLLVMRATELSTMNNKGCEKWSSLVTSFSGRTVELTDELKNVKEQLERALKTIKSYEEVNSSLSSPGSPTSRQQSILAESFWTGSPEQRSRPRSHGDGFETSRSLADIPSCSSATLGDGNAAAVGDDASDKTATRASSRGTVVNFMKSTNGPGANGGPGGFVLGSPMLTALTLKEEARTRTKLERLQQQIASLTSQSRMLTNECETLIKRRNDLRSRIFLLEFWSGKDRDSGLQDANSKGVSTVRGHRGCGHTTCFECAGFSSSWKPGKPDRGSITTGGVGSQSSLKDNENIYSSRSNAEGQPPKPSRESSSSGDATAGVTITNELSAGGNRARSKSHEWRTAHQADQYTTTSAGNDLLHMDGHTSVGNSPFKRHRRYPESFYLELSRLTDWATEGATLTEGGKQDMTMTPRRISARVAARTQQGILGSPLSGPICNRPLTSSDQVRSLHSPMPPAADRQKQPSPWRSKFFTYN